MDKTFSSGSHCHGYGNRTSKGPRISIPCDEYGQLLRCAEEYERLKAALISGGASYDVLNSLISGEMFDRPSNLAVNVNDWHENDYPITMLPPHPATLPESPDWSDMPRNIHDKPMGHRHPESPGGPFHKLINSPDFNVPSRRYRSTSYGSPNLQTSVDLSSAHGRSVMESSDSGNSRTAFASHGQNDLTLPYPCRDQRTLHITNLPEDTSYQDILDVIRGGRVLDIVLGRERSARVSMVEGAADLLLYAKRNDLYIKNKRVRVTWNNQQLFLTPHVSRKIANGATRNFIIKKAAHVIDETDLRHHMEHIHSLCLIDIKLLNEDVVIRTNSIPNALFARTCMMSRLQYKRYSIDFLPDECAAPLLIVQRLPTLAPILQPNKSALGQAEMKLLANRYNVLRMEDGEESENEENYPPGRRISDEDTFAASESGTSTGYL